MSAVDAASNAGGADLFTARRIGGATFQIPTEVRADRKLSLSIKWLIHWFCVLPEAVLGTKKFPGRRWQRA